jgi:hypothetical protein
MVAPNLVGGGQHDIFHPQRGVCVPPMNDMHLLYLRMEKYTGKLQSLDRDSLNRSIR